jgi:SH3-like domain-containing protein
MAPLFAVSYGVFVACKILSQCHAEGASSAQYNRNLIYVQHSQIATPADGNVSQTVILKNDGNPFRLHRLPSEYSLVTAILDPLEKSVELLDRCKDRWCYVRHSGAVGWLSADRFLTDPTVPPAPPPQTTETDEADQNATKVAEIPLPVRKGPVPPLPQPSPSAQPPLPDVRTTATTTKPIELDVSRIEAKNYALKELGGRLFLPVHENRTEISRIVGTIPFYARNVEALGECINSWCRIRQASLEGWIRQRHLTDQPATRKPLLQLEPVMPVDALNVYSAPNKEAKLVATIQPPVTDIEPLETCDERWCLIRHLDTVGWIEPKYLTRQ